MALCHTLCTYIYMKACADSQRIEKQLDFFVRVRGSLADTTDEVAVDDDV